MSSFSAAAKLIDLEQLQQLSYERSRKWATFLDNIAESENHSEIPIEQVEEFFGEDEEEDENELSSMEDDSYDDKSLDSEVLRDITNSTRLALMLNGSNMKTSTCKIPEDAGNEGNNELIDLFNQTLPVINEHNRQMKESGFDRILNTFDAKKIEEKVGGWLRRHNSLCGAADYVMAPSRPNRITRGESPCVLKKAKTVERFKRLPAYYKNCHREEETDSDDSFHSGETARYIRSSRAGAIKNSSSTTMMIKTYRMVKSTRQALRDKYACDQDDATDSHLDELRHRRKMAKELAMRHRNEKHLHKPMVYQYMTPSGSAHSQRRKILRKRTTSNGCSAVESSSESDSYYYDDDGGKYDHRKHAICCNQHHCSRYTPMSHTKPSCVTASAKRAQYHALKKSSSLRSNGMYYYIQSHTHSISSSSPSNSFTQTTARKRLKRLNSCPYNDTRPCRRESECRCCNDKRLCKEYKHLADTSTEEWFVENCFSPGKQAQSIVSSEGTVANPSESIERDGIGNGSTESTIKSNGSVDEPLPCRKTRKLEVEATKKTTKVSGKTTKGKKKTTKALEKSGKSDQEEPKEDSFELQLQLALKISKEEYEQKRKTKTAKDQEVIHINEDENANDNSSINSISNNRNITISGTEETFFASSKIIYNSTTVEPDNIKENAKAKQLDGILEDSAKVEKNKDHTILPNKIIRKNQPVVKSRKDTDNDRGKYAKRLINKGSEERNRQENELNNNNQEVTAEPKVKTKKLQETEHNESIRNSASKSKKTEVVEDHIFAIPQAAPKIYAQQKKISNIGRTETRLLNTSRATSTSKTINNHQTDNGTNINSMRTSRHLEVSQKATETTFFASSHGICNSTAKSHDTDAGQRQQINKDLEEKKQEKSKGKSTFKEETAGKKMPVETIEERKALAMQTNNIESNSMIDATPDSDVVYISTGECLPQEKTRKGTKTTKQDLDHSNAKDLPKSKRKCEKKVDEVQEFNNEENRKLIKTSKDKRNKEYFSAKYDKEHEEYCGKEVAMEEAKQVTPMNNLSREECKKDDMLNINNSMNRLEQVPPLKERINNNSNREHSRILDKVTKKPTPSQRSTTKGKKSNNSSNVTSTTTIHTPEKSKSKTRLKRILIIDSCSEDNDNHDSHDENDCTVVSSTTNVDHPTTELNNSNELQISSNLAAATTSFSSQSLSLSGTAAGRKLSQNKTLPSELLQHSKKGILIYAPHNSSLAPAHSFSNDGCFFNVTQEHLSKIIGEKPAEKFLKYYIGRRRFNSKSTIYFRPPPAGVLDTNDTLTSDSDEDVFDCMGQYGDLYESFGGSGGGGGGGGQ